MPLPAQKSSGHCDPWTQANLMSFLPCLLPAATWVWVLVPECIETLSQLEVFAYAIPSACNVLPCSLCCLVPSQPLKLRLIISLKGFLWLDSIFFPSVGVLNIFRNFFLQFVIIYFFHLFFLSDYKPIYYLLHPFYSQWLIKYLAWAGLQ